ncbi:mitochondrial ribonuclease P protein 1 homolog [Chrysoperla carnea]|uniref:mitochondrial ribonuclease P protein 1 homolog n=1 Tax=Chrysoperla carnea TaxID=189513 RepID=UPI001D060CB4|nr:mitochondrial ribonuclease P protein 1 homolog [Chrysoperla carnea]
MLFKIAKLSKQFLITSECIQPCILTSKNNRYFIKKTPIISNIYSKILYKSYCSSTNDNKSSETQIYGSLTDDQVKNITDGDPDLEKKLKLLILETEVLRQDGQKVPSTEFIKDFQWKELLSKDTKSSRRKYLSFLFSIEKKKENRIEKKNLKRKELEERKAEDKPERQYGLGANTILLRIYETTMNQQANNRLIQAMQFNQKLVIDCGYDEHMNNMEKINTAKQLMLLFAENRAHSEPFDLHYCNANFNEKVMQALNRHIPTLLEPWFPLHVHTKSYLDIFPKEKLVYMTPHCRDDLVEYDHDAIYIIGAMVDKMNNEPLSLAKAKKEGLRMKRLPLDRYLQWGSGSGKSLTLNQMVSILLDVKTTGDWNYALRHVPRRKVMEIGHNILRNDKSSLRFNKNSSRTVKSYPENSKEIKSNFQPDRKMRKSKLLVSSIFNK